MENKKIHPIRYVANQTGLTPHLIRAWAQTATAVSLVNVALVIAWRIPAAVPFIAAAFLGSYLYSFAVEGARWLRRT